MLVHFFSMGEHNVYVISIGISDDCFWYKKNRSITHTNVETYEPYCFYLSKHLYVGQNILIFKGHT